MEAGAKIAREGKPGCPHTVWRTHYAPRQYCAECMVWREFVEDYVIRCTTCQRNVGFALIEMRHDFVLPSERGKHNQHVWDHLYSEREALDKILIEAGWKAHECLP